MSLSTTIWHGTYHEPEKGPKGRLKPLASWTAILLCFALLRLLMPFHPTDSAIVHSRIVDALGAGLLWGRQSLIGSLEFPTFVTIALLFVRQIARLLPTQDTHLLVVLAQTWTFFYLLRIPRTLRGRCVTTATFLALVTSPEFQSVFFTDNPNWMATVPVAAALYHLIRWQRYNSLRDAIVLAVNCGLLAFCGPAGLVCALVILVVSTLNIRRLPRLYDTQNMTGVGLLLWAPFCYCASLTLLANWLIMRNAFFPLASLAPALTPENLRNLPRAIPQGIGRMPWISIGGLAIAFCSVVGRRRVAAEGLAATLVALFVMEGLFGLTPVHIPGIDLFQLILGVSAVLFPGLFLFELFESTWQRNATILLTGATLFACIAFPRTQTDDGNQLLGNPPTRDEIEQVADLHWQDARIAVFGARAAATFFDAAERRFLLRLDFHPGELLRQAGEEQIYLLVPPNDGRFYAPDSALATIHAHGADWLFIEHVWESGWQIGRCVVYDPPPTTPY